jgi:hypothetical protein
LHTRPSQPHYRIRRTRPGRYVVLREGQVVWRSTNRYFNETGDFAFGPHAFAFDSWGRRGLLLTDLRSPERLVLRGRGNYPIGFTNEGQLLVAGRRAITVLSPRGAVARRVRFRRSSSFAFDEQSETVYFVTPRGVLTSAHGSAVRRIRTIRARGWISLLEHGLLTFASRRHLAILRRSDGSLVASATWRGERRELDADVALSGDGRVFAFRVARDPGTASVYLLRAGEHRAELVYRHHFRLEGCGFNVSIAARGSSFLYYSDDGRRVAVTAVVTARGARSLTPLLRALPRKEPAMSIDAYWEADFTS